MRAIARFFHRWGAISGRATRREWLGLMLFSLAIEVGFCLLIYFGFRAAGIDIAEDLPRKAEAWAWGSLISGLLLIMPIAFWFRVATAVRRMHDQGKSGLFLLVMLMPFVGGLVFLVITLLPGEEEWNRFGPNPRDPDQLAAADEEAAIEAERLASDGPVRRAPARAVVAQASSSTSQ